MKTWVRKFLDQFEIDWDASKNQKGTPSEIPTEMSEDRASLLYILDSYTKHMFETEKHPVRKSRETFDELVKMVIGAKQAKDSLFKLRQYFASHRLDEFTYIQSTFDDFKKIIWDFADHLNEEAAQEENEQNKVADELNLLREAVEADSIDSLKEQARKFIDAYADFQAQLHANRDKRLTIAKKSLSTVRKKLSEANQNLYIDHLTQAHNRKAFDEKIRDAIEAQTKSQIPCTIVALDIDHFKAINDKHGHDVGDFVLKELTNLLKKHIHSPEDQLARIGGEEFALVFSKCELDKAIKKTEVILNDIRKSAFAHAGSTIKFTVSAGIAEFVPGENADKWVKRADSALYHSKQNGRNRYTVANHPPKMVVVA